MTLRFEEGKVNLIFFFIFWVKFDIFTSGFGIEGSKWFNQFKLLIFE